MNKKGQVYFTLILMGIVIIMTIIALILGSQMMGSQMMYGDDNTYQSFMDDCQDVKSLEFKYNSTCEYDHFLLHRKVDLKCEKIRVKELITYCQDKWKGNGVDGGKENE